MIIYGDLRSGNCLKVKYTVDRMGLDYEWIDVDIMAGGVSHAGVPGDESRRPGTLRVV